MLVCPPQVMDTGKEHFRCRILKLKPSKPQPRPTIERRYWRGGLPPNAKPLIWPAKGPGRPLALLRAVPTADHPRPSLSLAAVAGPLCPRRSRSEPEFSLPTPTCSAATRITVPKQNREKGYYTIKASGIFPGCTILADEYNRTITVDCCSASCWGSLDTPI